MFLVCDKLIRNGKTEYTRLLISETDRKRFEFGAQPDLYTPVPKSNQSGPSSGYIGTVKMSHNITSED
jgi:hypothetical protein